MKIIKIWLIWILIIICAISTTFALESGNVNMPKTLIELQESIRDVLKETNTAGTGIVMINGDSTVWIGGLGKEISKTI